MVSPSPGRAGKGAANSEGGAQSGIKNSHHFSPLVRRGIKTSSKLGDREEEGGW